MGCQQLGSNLCAAPRAESEETVFPSFERLAEFGDRRSRAALQNAVMQQEGGDLIPTRFRGNGGVVNAKVGQDLLQPLVIRPL
jgi:hypothetical protein